MSTRMLDKIKISFSLVLLLLVATACKKNEKADLSVKSEDLLNVVYGQHPLNTMDVYLPAKRSDSTKVIILLHGGAWSAGDKEELTVLAKYYRDKGFAAVNLNFRLTKTTDNFRLKSLIEGDVPLAVNFIAVNAKAWNVSNEKFGMLGASSGAHLAMLYTYAFNAENKVKTVISLAGPTNLTDIRNIGQEQGEAVEWLIGSSLATDLSAYVQASPIAHVNSLSKPTLIFHGTSDVVVPIQQSRDLIEKLEQLNVDNDLISFNAGHALLTNPVNTESFLEKSEEWFHKYIK